MKNFRRKFLRLSLLFNPPFSLSHIYTHTHIKHQPSFLLPWQSKTTRKTPQSRCTNYRGVPEFPHYALSPHTRSILRIPRITRDERKKKKPAEKQHARKTRRKNSACMREGGQVSARSLVRIVEALKTWREYRVLPRVKHALPVCLCVGVGFMRSHVSLIARASSRNVEAAGYVTKAIVRMHDVQPEK